MIAAMVPCESSGSGTMSWPLALIWKIMLLLWWRCWFRQSHGWTPIVPVHDAISTCALIIRSPIMEAKIPPHCFGLAEFVGSQSWLLWKVKSLQDLDPGTRSCCLSINIWFCHLCSVYPTTTIVLSLRRHDRFLIQSLPSEISWLEETKRCNIYAALWG